MKPTFVGILMKAIRMQQAVIQRAFILTVFLASASCSSKAPESKPSDPTTTFSPSPTLGPQISTALYDASNLAAKYPSLINVPEGEPCKTAGNAFIRGKFNGSDINRCTNVKVESGWCDFSAIAPKFAALGKVTISNPTGGISEGKDPDAFFAAVKAAGWLPDQCGTVDGGGGVREPVVFLYREPKDGSGLGVMPVCLPLGSGAPAQFKNLTLCEI